MVYAAAFTTTSNDSYLKKVKVADSKTLSEQDRNEIFHLIKTSSTMQHDEFPVGWVLHALQPAAISASMLQQEKYNLNELSHDTAIALVERILAKGLVIQSLFVDTVGDAKKYEDKLRRVFTGRVEQIRVEKKADSLFPIVSAASIVAKVTRDRMLSEWKFAEFGSGECKSGVGTMPKRDFGSGYPSDPNTVKWLGENFDELFGFTTLIRFSWSTCERMLKEKGLKVQWKDDGTEVVAEEKKRKGCFLRRNGIVLSGKK